MAVDSSQVGRRGMARLLTVCAVLFGLFLMHGAPATAAEGCHGAMTAVAASPMTGGHHAAVLTAAPAGHVSGPAVRAAGPSGMPGMPCVSTPAHERTLLPAPDLLAVASTAVLAPWTLARLRAAADETARRGPPACGRDLLLQVCIART
ncbi:hypothetical protein ACWD4J_40350 [Streptomyces sp. NPDC002577]